MTTRQLGRDEWGKYFDHITRTLVHEKAPIYTEVRVMNPIIGAQVETAWQPLVGITFNPREETLEIATEMVDHMIGAPTEVYVIEGEEGLPVTVEVVADGTKQVIELRY